MSKNDKKTCILESAAKLFSRLGLDRTSTRDISKESKSNISMISYHFGGKEGLYKEVIKEFALKIQSEMNPKSRALLSQPLTAEIFKDEIAHIVSRMVHLRLEHPEISKILSREKIEGMPMCRDVHEEIFYPLIQNFIQLFQKAQDAKIVRKDLNPAVFFILLSEGILGFYEIIDCNTSLKKDCELYYSDKLEFIKQATSLYLTGALL